MLTISNPATFDWAGMSLADCAEGNARDTYFTLKLYDLLLEKLEGQPVMTLVENVIMPSLELFSDMEYNGLQVDTSQLDAVGRQLEGQNMNLEDELYECKGVKTSQSFTSNNDLCDILYLDEEGMGLYPPDRTGKGSPSVSAPTLKLLLEHIEEELQTR